MTRRALQPLVGISQLILDAALADLRRAADARDESLARLCDLATVPCPTDLPLAAVAQADLLYARWADARRAEINLTLARQTADWLGARDAARRAFGRADALRKLAEGR